MIAPSDIDEDSPWSYVVRRPPASAIVGYLLAQWQAYEAQYSGLGEPFATRSEPKLTEGLGAFLAASYEATAQPFAGEFYAELNRVDLASDGTRRFIGRTDIEWRLFGAPNFIVEFKVIGGGRPAKFYVSDGMTRFVDGRYGHRSREGAMWAFFRPGSSELVSHVEALIDAHLVPLRCQAEGGAHRIAPSIIAPGAAHFDSLHARDPALPSIRLAHMFVTIAPHPIPTAA